MNQTTSFNSNNSKKSIENGDYQKQLPLSIKNRLSPNARIKADRRANYMYRHSHDKIDTNLLILFHGAGDSHLPFHTFAKKMNLPQTATLSINANAMGGGFVTLPFSLGHTWFEEMDYQNTGDTLKLDDDRRLSSLKCASDRIDQFIIDELIFQEHKDGNDDNQDQKGKLNPLWLPERIFLLGYSAGASIVMNICYNRAQQGKRPLGGAICIAGGGLKGRIKEFKACNNEHKKKNEWTPILLIGGEKDETYPINTLQEDANLYNVSNESNLVKVFVQPGKKHGMIHQQEETKCMMEFFADKLVRRMVAMEGFTEVSSFAG